MLFALMLEAFCFSIVLFMLGHGLDADGFLLSVAELLVLEHLFVLLLLSLLLQTHLLVVTISITLTNIDDVIGFLLCFLNFFPGLNTEVLKQNWLPFIPLALGVRFY